MHLPSMLDYQQQLIRASLDDFTPNATLPNFCGGQYGPEPSRWRLAVVDFLCASLGCGLIEVTHRPDISAKRDVEALKKLLVLGDAESGLDKTVLWDALYFNGTKELVRIIDECSLHSWQSLIGGENERLAELLKGVYGKFNS